MLLSNQYLFFFLFFYLMFDCMFISIDLFIIFLSLSLSFSFTLILSSTVSRFASSVPLSSFSVSCLFSDFQYEKLIQTQFPTRNVVRFQHRPTMLTKKRFSPFFSLSFRKSCNKKKIYTFICQFELICKKAKMLLIVCTLMIIVSYECAKRRHTDLVF